MLRSAAPSANPEKLSGIEEMSPAELPTVVVVTRNQYQVVCGTKDGANDPTQILAVIQGALAQTR